MNPAECLTSATQPGESPLRRLTRTEYNHTVGDLLNDATGPATQFPEEARALHFTNNTEAQSVSSLLIEGYETAARALAARAVADIPKLLGCDPVAQGDACMRRFAISFGLKAYRRPLATAEVDRFVAFYNTQKQVYDVPTGVRMFLEAVLQSPNFLYRVEAQGTKGVARLSSYELAQRLSYLLWSSIPDATLFDAAQTGRLDTASGVKAEAERMLADPRADRSVRTFFSEWLSLDARIDKDAAVFPGFTPAVRQLVQEESQRFTSDVVKNGGGLDALLLGNYSFMNKPLADYYRATGATGATGAAFQKVTLDSSKRVGVLTQAGVMAAFAKANQTSPVERGVFIRDRFLCDPVPAPPNNIPSLPPPDPSLTTRERLAAHRSAPACRGCHELMDPIGFGFEHFDGAGLWRDQENGRAIDATGEVVESDIDGTFDGAVALANKLGASTQVRKCVAKQWFRFGSGRSEGDVDQCSLVRMNAAFADGPGDFTQLIIALTQTDAFLFRDNQ